MMTADDGEHGREGWPGPRQLIAARRRSLARTCTTSVRPWKGGREEHVVGLLISPKPCSWFLVLFPLLNLSSAELLGF